MLKRGQEKSEMAIRRNSQDLTFHAVLSDEGAIVRQRLSVKHSARYLNASTGKQLTCSLDCGRGDRSVITLRAALFR